MTGFTMDRPWVAIQRNPKSGSGRRRRELVALCRGLVRFGLTPRLFTDRAELDSRVTDVESRQHLVCIVAAGGDGTMVDVVNRHPDLPLAVLPMGTENLLARYLGLGRDGGELAEVIHRGETRTIDTGRINDQLFVLVASAGFDAWIAHELARTRSGNISHLTYLRPIWRALRTYTFPRMRIYLDDGPDPLEGVEVMISNLPAYGMKLQVGQSAVENDGKLTVTVMERGSAFQMIRYSYNLFRGTHEQLPDVRVETAQRIRVELVDPDQRVPVQIDGDPAGSIPMELECLPSQLRVFVPPTD